MSETELTKEIKRSLIYYKTEMNNEMRTVRYASEVNVITGFVDFIRFEDYIQDDYTECKNQKCKIEGSTFPNKHCKACIHKIHSYNTGILTTCFEIKITLSDFKSKNGHNFVGNRNYYVVPKDLSKKITDYVPDDVGIIAYYGDKRLRKVKECKFKQISEQDLNWYLYNAFKKWVDNIDLKYKEI